MTHCSDSYSDSVSDENCIGFYAHFFPISDTNQLNGQCEQTVRLQSLVELVYTQNAAMTSFCSVQDNVQVFIEPTDRLELASP